MSRKLHLLICATLFVSSPAWAKKGFGHGGANQQQQQQQTATPPAAPTESTPAPTEPSAAAKAQADLQAVEKKLRADFDASPELKQAQDEVKQAQADYDTAAKNALGSNADYEAAIEKQKQLEVKLQDARNNPDQHDAIPQLAMDSMANKNAIRRMEQQASSADPAVGDAKTKLKAAQDKLMKMRRDFLASMLQNPEYVAAKQALDEAKPATAKHPAAEAAAGTNAVDSNSPAPAGNAPANGNAANGNAAGNAGSGNAGGNGANGSANGNTAGAGAAAQ